MRIPILCASAAALALGACDNGPISFGNRGSEAADSLDVSDSALEDQVMSALADAPSHGLTKDLFLKGELPSDDGQRRQRLLQVAKDYASALAVGKVDPAKISEVYTLPRPRPDVAAGLAQALSQNRYREWVNSLAPQTEEYRALSQAFVQLVQRAPALPDDEIPAGRTIKPGAADPRVPAIVANLRAQGYLPAPDERRNGKAEASRYTRDIARAVAQFQADTGRKPDGIIGPDTLAALSSGPRDRARQLAVAMERLRWLDRNPPATRIDVNTAATLLDYWRDGAHQEQRRVVTGQPEWETPQLGSPIFQLVANPSWNVPDSIVEDEISKKSGAWLAANRFVREDGRWVQQPGPKNSLGEVKFDMKNKESIYLHDTPAKALFALPERHESHGCVRVEGAVDFARLLAEQDGVLDKFDEAMASGEEKFVDLKTQIPVRLMYLTAFLGADGRVRFVDDVYGWDNAVAEALGYERRQPESIRHRAGDVGP